MQQHLAPIIAAARVIEQALGQQTQHSPTWRVLLQAIRNADASPQLGLVGLARIYQAALVIFAVEGNEPYAAEKISLRDAILSMGDRLGFYAESPSGVSMGPTICNDDGWILDGEAF